MKPGEIYVVDLELAAKVRSCVVVARDDPDAPRKLVVFVPLTTANRVSDSTQDVVLRLWPCRMRE